MGKLRAAGAMPPGQDGPTPAGKNPEAGKDTADIEMTERTDKQPKGTVRRNERQWSAVSVQELEEISAALDLAEPLTADTIGANICLAGIDELSRLPKGTTLRFPSGAELMVEEYNPPCLDMGTKIASTLATNSGESLQNTDFSKAAKLTRGVVGTVEVAGIINPGDAVEITLYAQPEWLNRS